MFKKIMLIIYYYKIYIKLLINLKLCLSSLNNEYNFLPLHVDYQEKFYSIGRIPFGCKRESKLNDHEILISRLVDRCIRPCINKTIKNVAQKNTKRIVKNKILCYNYWWEVIIWLLN